MYGGWNFKTRQLNYATNSIRQAGSTMKPFVLAQALNDGISVNSVYPGPAELIVDGEDFKNYGDTNYGQMTLRDATRLSVNTIYVQLMQQVKPDRVAKFAKAHGLAAELDGRAGPTGPAAARGPARAQARPCPVPGLRGRHHPPAGLGLRDLGQPRHPPDPAPGREGGRLPRPGAGGDTAAPRAPR